MSTNLKPTVVETRDRCAVCGDDALEAVIDLPNLPLTGLFTKGPAAVIKDGIDQKLLFCISCGHAQLSNRVATEMLYGDSYAFRTSFSNTARSGTEFFLSVLEKIAGKRQFECVVDVGCNDLHLLKRLRERAKVRVGIDPLWSVDSPPGDEEIVVISDLVEEANLSSIAPRPDLILCRHTLEHIDDPRPVLEKLFSVARDEALFIFEIPAFESLVRKFRFDQVFHQHQQYFSLSSLRGLVEELGGSYVGHFENYHDWGALAVAFTKKGKRDEGTPPRSFPYDVLSIQKRYRLFRGYLAQVREVLESLRGFPVYGYGAAQMLPTLAYHLESDLSMLACVLDDDPAKDGRSYANLPLTIRLPQKIKDLEEASVFITAVDSVKPILNKLLERRPRHIIYPLPVI